MWGERFCPVCGELHWCEMCPARYLSPHDQDTRDRVEVIVWCHMVSEGRDEATLEDWRYGWRWRMQEPPLAVVSWPG